MYVEYKGVQHPVKEGATPDQVAQAIVATYPDELSNYQLVLKEGDPNGFVLTPKFGSKG